MWIGRCLQDYSTLTMLVSSQVFSGKSNSVPTGILISLYDTLVYEILWPKQPSNRKQIEKPPTNASIFTRKKTWLTGKKTFSSQLNDRNLSCWYESTRKHNSSFKIDSVKNSETCSVSETRNPVLTNLYQKIKSHWHPRVNSPPTNSSYISTNPTKKLTRGGVRT